MIKMHIITVTWQIPLFLHREILFRIVFKDPWCQKTHLHKIYLFGWRNSSVGKLISLQEWRPEFSLQNQYKNTGQVVQLLSQQSTGMKESLGLIGQPTQADQQDQEQWMTRLKKNQWRKAENYLQRLVYGLYLQIWIDICLHMNMNTHTANE